MEQMEQECRAGSNPLFKNKLIIQCIEEHYAKLAGRKPDETDETILSCFLMMLLILMVTTCGYSNDNK